MGRVIDDMFSTLGKRTFLNKGIMAQSAEAAERKPRLNATVGLSEKGGIPMHIPEVYAHFNGLSEKEVFSYAPLAGDPELRRLWKEDMIRKNPSLRGIKFSLPAVTAGLTGALSVVSHLFIEPDDPVLVPDLYWDNYDLLFKTLAGADLVNFSLFDREGRLDIPSLSDTVEDTYVEGRFTKIILNFPNNPSGYTPTEEEAEELLKELGRLAKKGYKLMVITDDAYFGLFYGEGVCKESLFSKLAAADDNLVAIKCDAATKEDLVWGFRIGFITVANPTLTDADFAVIENKIKGALRYMTSSCSRPAQSLLVRALSSEKEAADRAKQEVLSEMKTRYGLVKKAIEKESAGKEVPFIEPIPFNSGYFMSFRTLDSDLLRRTLLDKGLAVIAVGPSVLRFAYCALDSDKIEEAVKMIYESAEELWS